MIRDDALQGAEADEQAKAARHEEAAHEKRNWVRLTYDCNNHCIFCLDSLAHNGTVRSAMDVKVQIVEGRKKGATRLILSGGEPTIHPLFLEFVKLGRLAGYRRIQTVTNGRMFAYPEFLNTAADNGLDEITFSLHGHTAKLHDALVGTPGAFEQEVAGLRAALDSGRFIVNVDIVINKMNVKHLPEMLETFIGWGVREFDLLQVIPFGTAWGKAKDALFYDLEGHEEPLRRAFEYSRRPDLHIWLNRFPPPFAEGFEELIQDPYKLNDEVRGRREEFDRYLSHGTKLDCREPDRCRHCYLEGLCDGLDRALDERAAEEVDVIRVEHPGLDGAKLPRARSVHIVAPTLAGALSVAAQFPGASLRLELADASGLTEALAADDALAGRVLERCYASDAATAEALASVDAGFDIAVELTRDTADFVKSGRIPASRLIVVQPKYDRVTDEKSRDADVAAVCGALPAGVRTANVPPCLGGREPEAPGRVLDAAVLGGDARVDMQRYAERYVADRFMTKSRRCASCRHDASCPGVHINFARAHGYAVLRPVPR
jgi:MoaA/NifB/PqqE/SkfB family radical SAM enzyme